MTRIDFMNELAYNFDEFSCQMYFGVSRDALEDGTATWNQALEYAYNEYLDGIEEERLKRGASSSPSLFIICS